MPYSPSIARGILGKTRYSYNPTLNADKTKGMYIKASPFDGLAFFAFDAVNLQMTALETTSTLDFNDARWHNTSPNLTIGHAILGRSIIIRDITGATSDVTYAMDATFPSNGYIFQFSTSENHDVFAFTVKRSDGPEGVIYTNIGYGYIKTNGEQGYFALTTVDEVQINRTGNKIVIKDTARKVYIRDIPGSSIFTLNPGSEDFPGHSDVGANYIVGYSDMTGPGGAIYAWALADGARSSAWYAFPDYSQGVHVALGSGTETEVVLSTYKVNGDPTPGDPVINEVFRLTSAGVITHILSHLSAFNDFYWGAPRADWSRPQDTPNDFICLTSNFGGVGTYEVVIVRASNPEDPPDPGGGGGTPAESPAILTFAVLKQALLARLGNSTFWTD